MARFWKYCPVCLHRKIGHPIVNTCGSRPCIRAWRNFSIEQRDSAEQVAEQKRSELMAQIANLLNNSLERN